MKIKLTLSYLGTNYSGWQYQDNAPTVQGEVEKALKLLYQTDIRVTGVGRTDEGVHALAYVCHYEVDKMLDCGKIALGLNRYLPQDISALNAEVVDDSFCARRSAISKTYCYRMYVSRYRKPFYDQTVTQIYTQPNIDKMRQAAQLLVGEHDYSAFARTGSNLVGTVRKVYSIDITQQEEIIDITVCGNAFLYNMVRNIAGALLWVGNGKLTVEDISQMLIVCKKIKYYKTMPSHGLTLLKADY